MDWIAPLHPAIVHLPIAWLIGSALFEIVARLTDLDWWRRAATVLLVLGVLGGGLAVLSGKAAEEPAEERQGVPEQAIEAHETMAWVTVGLGVAALLVRGAARVMPMPGFLGALALLLQLATAAAVGITGYRGGRLVFDHAAGVRLHGELLRSGPLEREAPPDTTPH